MLRKIVVSIGVAENNALSEIQRDMSQQLGWQLPQWLRKTIASVALTSEDTRESEDEAMAQIHVKSVMREFRTAVALPKQWTSRSDWW